MVELVLSLIHTQHTPVCMCVVLVLRVSLSPALCAAISLWRTTYVLILPCKSQLKTCAPLFLFIVYKWAQQATLSHALPLSAAEVMLTLSLALSSWSWAGKKQKHLPSIYCYDKRPSAGAGFMPRAQWQRERRRERKRERASVWESFGCKDKSKCKLKKLWQPWQVCYVCLCVCFFCIESFAFVLLLLYTAHTHTHAHTLLGTHTHTRVHTQIKVQSTDIGRTLCALMTMKWNLVATVVVVVPVSVSFFFFVFLFFLALLNAVRSLLLFARYTL